MLTEGIDVPNIDCVVFADPRKSKVDIVQALGRALRKKKGKEWGYVILPVVYDGDTNEIDNDNFNEIINIIRGLAANDERIVEYFKDKAQKGKGSGEMIKGSDLFSLDSSMLEEKDLANQLQIKLWEKLSKFQWMPFDEAREYVRALGLTSTIEWRIYSKSDDRPSNIPVSARNIYKDKWISMGDWLGTDYIATRERTYCDFKKARFYARNLNIKTYKDWVKYHNVNKIPDDIPKSADLYYKNKGWISWGDFLGTGVVADRLKKWMPFQEAKKIVRGLGLKSGKEWKEYCKSDKKPKNIPSHPDKSYKKMGWKNWIDWLGTQRVSSKQEYMDFAELRSFAHSLKLQRFDDWLDYWKKNKKPDNIPLHPRKVYKNKGWKNTGDFLNVVNYLNKEFWEFKKARIFVRKIGLKNQKEWDQYMKSKNRPVNIPVAPYRVYKKKGWVSMGDWLGTKIGFDGSFLSFEEAREYVRAL